MNYPAVPKEQKEYVRRWNSGRISEKSLYSKFQLEIPQRSIKVGNNFSKFPQIVSLSHHP